MTAVIMYSGDSNPSVSQLPIHVADVLLNKGASWDGWDSTTCGSSTHAGGRTKGSDGAAVLRMVTRVTRWCELCTGFDSATLMQQIGHTLIVVHTSRG